MASRLSCVFCNEETPKILLFTAESLVKCKNIFLIREKFKLKYSNIVLPLINDEIHGYHVKCYKNFTSLNRKYVSDDSALHEPPVSTQPSNLQ